MRPEFQICAFVGQPILAAAGFQAALAVREDSRTFGKSCLKGGCRQDCLPHTALGALC
jgi:hypothetical protein